MMRALVAFIFAICILIDASGVSAAMPSVRQVICGLGVTSLTFPSTVVNGNTIVATAGAFGSVSGITFKDSNLQAYAQEPSSVISIGSGGQQISNAFWNGSISGSPGTTFTFSSGSSGPGQSCAYELTGTLNSGTFGTNSIAGPGSISAIVASVVANDILICQNMTNSGGSSISFSPAISQTQDTQNYGVIVHGITGSTTSTSCTSTSAGSPQTVSFGRYTIAPTPGASLLQAVVCGVPSPTLSFASAPVAGSYVASAQIFPGLLGTPTMRDSNALNYSMRVARNNAAGNGGSTADFGGFVSATPTSAFTFSSSSYACIYNIAGLSGAINGGTTDSPGATTVPVYLTSNLNDFVLCAVNTSGATTQSFIATSYGTAVTDSTTIAVGTGHYITTFASNATVNVNRNPSGPLSASCTNFSALIAAGLGSGFIGSSLL